MQKERGPHSCVIRPYGIKNIARAPVQPDLLEINSHLNIVNPALKRQIKNRKEILLMAVQMEYEKDVKVPALDGKKIAVIGYGSLRSCPRTKLA